MLYECCRQHRLREFRRQRAYQGMGPLGEMNMTLDVEKNNNQNWSCCAQNLVHDGRNVTLPMSNLFPSPDRLAVLMTVFRTYKEELKCDVLEASLTLPHVLFSLCFLVYLLFRISFIFKCILQIIHSFPSQYPLKLSLNKSVS